MKWVIIAVLPAIMALGCQTTESFIEPDYDFAAVERVAVLDITGDIRGDVPRNQVADFFAMQLLQKGYSPIERTQVQSLLEERQFQPESLTSTEDATQAGRILDVQAVMFANVAVRGDRINLTARMVDVETGQIVWIASAGGTTGRTAGTVAGGVAGGLLGGRIGGGRTAGVIVGGVLGGIAGRELTPATAQATQAIVRNMGDTLPDRR